MLKKTLIVCAILLLGSYFTRTNKETEISKTLDTTTNGTEKHADIALIPLDSRPANTYSPLMVAKAAGLKLVMPETQLLDNYKIPGNIQSYPDWLLEVEADYYVISISQLCYGGLVASRTGEALLEDAKKNLEFLRALKKKIGAKPIYAFDTIQRLAITSGDSRTAQYYGAMHNWAILKDEVENLGHTHKKAELQSLEDHIPSDIREDYLKARERNHIINNLAIDLVNEGVIDYLILAQDDAAPTGLHRVERELLKDKVEKLALNEKVMIFPGADEVGVVLVSRVITKHYALEPSFEVFYRGVNGNNWIADFEDVNFAENISRHLTAAGAKLAKESLLDLFVVTPGGNNSVFIKQIDEHIKQDKKVVICDVARTNKADPEFFIAMQNNLELVDITGYAGWNTAGNTLGLALGQGIAALAREKLSDDNLLLANKAHLEYLLHRLAKDYYYKQLVQGSIERWAKNLGFDTMNLPANMVSFVEEELNYQLQPHLRQLYSKHFASKQFGNLNLGSSVSWNIKLVWPRFFEIGIEPDLELRAFQEGSEIQ